jgi:AraC-like DNA-binding protein
VSTRSLQRILTSVGLCFSQIVRLFRVHESCRLLEETEYSITIIGFCTGFSDAANFSKDFKLSMGMSPSEYRYVCHSVRQQIKLIG